MSTPVRLRRPVAAAGLAFAALTLGAVAGTGPSYAGIPAHNEQVVLANETNAQADDKSAINGTAQVASYDGRYVVFSTAAPLVASDTNATDDVYLRDTVDGITILVSQKGGTPGNDYSLEPTISNDGRYVAFTTYATNLFKDHNGSTLDVAVKDLFTDKTRLVSVSTGGKQYKKNSFFPVISGNGRRVSFQSFAPFGAKDQDKREDVYVRDLAGHWTRQVSLTPKGTDVKPSILNGDISDNGNLVTFGEANDLWVRNVNKGTTRRFWHEPDSPPCQGFPIGSAGRPVISGDGTYVAFSSCATKLPGPATHGQVYRMKLATGKITLVTRPATSGKAGNADSFLPSLSRSGRFVGFGSDASNLAGVDTGTNTDAFVADLKKGTIVRASQAPDGTEGGSWSASTGAAISGDGHTLVYESYATNLVPADQYDWEEVFAWRA
jgi:Tol biopolymer transport system component